MITDTHWVEQIDPSSDTADRYCFYFMAKHTTRDSTHVRKMAEIYEWCQATFGVHLVRWIHSRDLFYFSDPSDAALFKLTWC